MSLSAKNTAPEDEDFAEIEFRPKPVKNDKPVVEDKQGSPAPATETTDPSPEQPATPAPVQEKEKSPRGEKRSKWAIFFDVILVASACYDPNIFDRDDSFKSFNRELYEGFSAA
jgi:hypothetical protein